MPATDCDIDHTTPYEHGGDTTLTNTAALCRYHHHRIKHEGRWTYQRQHDGTYLWHSPLGTTYHNTEPARQPAAMPP